MHLGLQTSQDELLKFKTSIKIWKKSDLRDFECGMVVVYVYNNISTSETSDLSFKYGANSEECSQHLAKSMPQRINAAVPEERREQLRFLNCFKANYCYG